MKPLAFGSTVALAALLSSPADLAGQAQVNLKEFLPYNRGSSSSLLSPTTGNQFRFFSTRDNEFFWDFRKGTPQRRVNYRSMSLRVDAGGLSILGDTFYDPLAHGNTYRPAWAIAPLMVAEEQVVESSATITPVGVGSKWGGTVKGRVTFGNLATQQTIAGRLQALPMTFRHDWMESGDGGRGGGTVEQTWWMTREIGVVNVEFSFSETNSIGEVTSGAERFILLSTTLPFSPEVVSFPDSNLEAAVRAQLSKPAGNLTTLDLAGLAELPAGSRGITNLSGLESAFLLSVVQLMSNQVTELSPLANMTQLKILDLRYNQIRSLQPLSGLRSLTSLQLSRNSIADLSPISGANRLLLLKVDENQIQDVSPLSNLTNLTSLVLGANQIRDVRALAGLAAITQLEIEANRITDITPLTALTRLQDVSVEENCLDLRPGTKDRQVIDAWIRSRIQVEEEWLMQNDCSSIELVLEIAREADVLVLLWQSTLGVGYIVESSADFFGWSPAHLNAIAGTGGIFRWPIPNPIHSSTWFRLRVVPKP